jgi:hypothetical protein
MWANLYSITFTQTSVISFPTVNTPFPLKFTTTTTNKQKQQKTRCFPTLTWLVPLLANKRPILVDNIPGFVVYSQEESYRWFSDLLYHVFPAIFVVCIDVLTPDFTLLRISYSFYENSDSFRCNKMHIYHSYCRNHLKRQSVFSRPIVS